MKVARLARSRAIVIPSGPLSSRAQRGICCCGGARSRSPPQVPAPPPRVAVRSVRREKSGGCDWPITFMSRTRPPLASGCANRNQPRRAGPNCLRTPVSTPYQKRKAGCGRSPPRPPPSGRKPAPDEAPVPPPAGGLAARILVDANVLMYAAGSAHPFQAPSLALLERIARGGTEAVRYTTRPVPCFPPSSPSPPGSLTTLASCSTIPPASSSVTHSTPRSRRFIPWMPCVASTAISTASAASGASSPTLRYTNPSRATRRRNPPRTLRDRRPHRRRRHG